MMSFLRKKNPEAAADAKPAPVAPAARPAPPSTSVEPRPQSGRKTTPGVQMLKEVWHIDTVKKKKDIAPPGIPTDIYCVPKQRQMPPRHGSGTG